MKIICSKCNKLIESDREEDVMVVGTVKGDEVYTATLGCGCGVRILTTEIWPRENKG